MSAIDELINARRFAPDVCFLCGVDLVKENSRPEHVIPQWMQRRYNLWNQTMQLQNGTSIRYSQLVVPCCATCNGGPLKALEDRVAAAMTEGHRAFEAVDELTLFQWAGKIFYGLLFREGFLRQDRSSSSGETIVSEEMLENIRVHHLFLQSLRRPVKFDGFSPFSVFRVPLVDSDARTDNFWFSDSYPGLMLTITVGGTGLLVSMQDNGLLRQMLGTLEEQLADQPLTMTEFLELDAQLTYLRLKMNRTPKYLIIGSSTESGPVSVISPPLAGFSGTPLFDRGHVEEYAQLLGRNWSAKPADLIGVGSVHSELGQRSPSVFPASLVLDPQSPLVRPGS